MLELALKIAGVAALGLLLLTVFLYVTQRSQLYFPWPDAPPTPAGVEALTVATDDGLRLGAWFVVAGGSSDPGPAVLVCNGNAGSRAHRLPLAEALAERGYHVLLFDYRGYAGNPGEPSQDGLLTDARAAARALRERPEVDPDRIAYYGESLGAAVCTGLATERPPAAMVLRSPFPSVHAMARRHYPYLPIFEPMIHDRWPLQRWIGQVEAPLLVMVGERDEIVPPELSRRVYDAAPEPKRFVELAAAHHNDERLLAGDELMAEVSAFLGERVE